MSGIFQTLFSLLLITSGPNGLPLRIPEMPDLPCCGHWPTALEQVAPATSGFLRRQQLRGVCLILSFPAAAADSSSSGDRAVGLISLVKRAAGRTSAQTQILLQSVAALTADWSTRVQALLPDAARALTTGRKLTTTAKSQSGTCCTGGNGYWDYYGDCDRWNVILIRMQFSGAAGVGSTDRDVRQAGRKDSDGWSLARLLNSAGWAIAGSSLAGVSAAEGCRECWSHSIGWWQWFDSVCGDFLDGCASRACKAGLWGIGIPGR